MARVETLGAADWRCDGRKRISTSQCTRLRQCSGMTPEEPRSACVIFAVGWVRSLRMAGRRPVPA
jgi:hypothetical protein